MAVAHFVLCVSSTEPKAPKNKETNVFIDVPSQRYKLSAIKTHANSDIHKQSIQKEALQQLSVIHKLYMHKIETNEKTLEQAFSIAYLVMKLHMPNTKFLPILNFIEKEPIGVTDLQNFSHRSKGSLQEIFLTIGESVKEEVLQIVRDSNTFGLLIDEVTDISVMSQLLKMSSP